MSKELFKKHIWLIDTINSRGKLTKAEIMDLWRHSSISDGEELPERTFHNYRQAISENFDIEIVCHKPTNTYSIDSSAVLSNNIAQKYLLESFSIQRTLMNRNLLGSRVELEDIPSNNRHLTAITEAMQTNSIIAVDYNSFWGTKGERKLKPYMLKLFKRRWYMVAKQVDSTIKTFALDRIKQLEITNETFEFPENFIHEAYFADSYGIEKDSAIKPENVELKIYGRQVDYIRELPLHSSQQEVEIKDNYSVFSYFISPTNDLMREILSKGCEIEVLTPLWFREKIAKEIESSQRLYQTPKIIDELNDAFNSFKK